MECTRNSVLSSLRSFLTLYTYVNESIKIYIFDSIRYISKIWEYYYMFTVSLAALSMATRHTLPPESGERKCLNGNGES